MLFRKNEILLRNWLNFCKFQNFLITSIHLRNSSPFVIHTLLEWLAQWNTCVTFFAFCVIITDLIVFAFHL